MALRLLEVERVRELAGCTRCGVPLGSPCDPQQLRPGSFNHAERVKAARYAEYEKERQRDLRREAIKA